MPSSSPFDTQHKPTPSMAYRKTLASRFFNMPKAHSSSPLIKKKPSKSNDAAARGVLRRFFFQSAAAQGGGLYLPMGEKLTNRIPGGLDGLLPLPMKGERLREGLNYISIEETKKVLRAAQMEAARARLRGLEKSQVSYSEFVEICCDVAGNLEQGMGVAKLLDDSGAVIVLGTVVFLRPDQVARAIESVMPLTMPNKLKDSRASELKAMEEKKAEIDGKAVGLVKKELWAGLGLLLLQTTGIMRLTFWELSWDVMEPICFFLTSIYFMAGYAFFLRTSRDPSFEGFFHCRFAAKQKRLMKTYKFDEDKFNELRKALCPSASVRMTTVSTSCCSCDHKDKTLLGVGH